MLRGNKRRSRHSSGKKEWSRVVTLDRMSRPLIALATMPGPASPSMTFPWMSTWLPSVTWIPIPARQSRHVSRTHSKALWTTSRKCREGPPGVGRTVAAFEPIVHLRVCSRFFEASERRRKELTALTMSTLLAEPLNSTPMPLSSMRQFSTWSQKLLVNRIPVAPQPETCTETTRLWMIDAPRIPTCAPPVAPTTHAWLFAASTRALLV